MEYTAIILILSILGVLLCKKIHREKKKDKPLVCYVGADCEGVVRGKFSTLFGIGLELYGLLYYLLVFLAYLFFYTIEFSQEPLFNLALVGVSGLAFLFSLGLTFIQAFVIRTWCSWCLISAALTTSIFILGFLKIF